MLATPLPGLKVFARDAVFRGSHMIDLHTLSNLYIAVNLIFPSFGMPLGKITLALLGCRP